LERPINISCTAGIFEEYVPPEGDGKVSPLSTTGAKQKVERVEKKTKSMLAIRKIRSFDDDFETKEFVKKAEEIYIDVHKYLCDMDEDKLHELVTEKCYPGMVMNLKNKTVRWKMLESLEPPRMVHARCASAMSKDNVYAQVTVRIHTRQTLAVYDRFGRLMNGSEVVAKDVLEYVVFEKHLSDQYGTWRLHAKIIPSWAPPKEPILRTFRKPPEADAPPPPAPTPPSEEVEDERSEGVGEVRPHPAQAADRPTPALA
jgi:large subunit ribosomal protein L45